MTSLGLRPPGAVPLDSGLASSTDARRTGSKRRLPPTMLALWVGFPPGARAAARRKSRPRSRVDIPPTVLAWWVAVCALNPSSVRPCYLLVGNPGSWPCPVSVRSHPAGPAGSVAEYRNPPFPRDTGPGGWTGPVSLGNEQFPRPATDGPPPRQGRAAPDAGAGVRRWMPAPSIVHGPAPGSVGFKNLAKWIARAVARGIRRHASKSRAWGGGGPRSRAGWGPWV